EAHDRPEIECDGDFGAALIADKAGQPPRQFSLAGPGECNGQHVGDDEAEDAVAEEFEALIAGFRPKACLDDGALMGERFFKKAAVAETVADPGLQAVKNGADLRQAVRHNTFRTRSKRTDHGHFQNCQAASPSFTEKKMISARPTMFSKG